MSKNNYKNTCAQLRKCVYLMYRNLIIHLKIIHHDNFKSKNKREQRSKN